MAILVTPIKKHKSFLVKFVIEYETDTHYHSDQVTTKVVIPDGKPMLVLLADTIFKCLANWAEYDETVKNATIRVTHYTRFCDETVVGFVDIERDRIGYEKGIKSRALNQYDNTLAYF